MIGALLAAASLADWRSSFSTGRYDVAIVGSGPKESLLAGLLAASGRTVLQLEPSEAAGGVGTTLDLQELSERCGAEGELNPAKVGEPADWAVDAGGAKVLMAGGQTLRMLVACGAWSHLDFRRVQRSLIYRKKEDGAKDVHRVLANVEDALKTRSLPALEKARVVQFFYWLEKFDEADASTWSIPSVSGFMNMVQGKKTPRLKMKKLSAPALLAKWELGPSTVNMLVRGMALHAGALKELSALALVRKLKAYKDSYKTFPHTTSPYVYPREGLGAALPKAVGKVLGDNGGALELGVPLEGLVLDDAGRCVGVRAGGESVAADCVVAGADHVPEHASEAHKVVRLFAVLNHPPQMCKDARSCQLLLPAAQVGRESDAYLFSATSTHRVAPGGYWLAVASAKVEGATDGLNAMQVAKRELKAALPLLKPARKLFAEMTTVSEASDGLPAGLHVLSTGGAESHLLTTADDVRKMYEEITGEPLDELIDDY